MTSGMRMRSACAEHEVAYIIDHAEEHQNQWPVSCGEEEEPWEAQPQKKDRNRTQATCMCPDGIRHLCVLTNAKAASHHCRICPSVDHDGHKGGTGTHGAGQVDAIEPIAGEAHVATFGCTHLLYFPCKGGERPHEQYLCDRFLRQECAWRKG